MTSTASVTGSEGSGGHRIFSGETEDYLEYKRWKLWISNKLRTMDKLTKENYGSYIFTCLSGKALESVEHLDPETYQKEGGDRVLLDILDHRFPEKEQTDEMAEILSQIFTLRAKEGESLRQWISRSTELFNKCERKTGVKFPPEAQGWMVLRWSGLSEEQQAVVKGRSLGVMKLDIISKSMRSVYPDFTVKRRQGVAAVVEEDSVAPDLSIDEGEVQGFDDVELFLTDFVQDDPDNQEHYEEGEIAEVLATTWREKRAELNKLQRQRKFSEVKDVKRAFRVEIEEMKKKTKCNRCGRVGHWARECRQKRDPTSNLRNPGSSFSAGSSGKPQSKETGAGLVVDCSTGVDELHFVASAESCPSLLEQVRLRTAAVTTQEEILLVSSPGYGVLDSGCGKTIIGRDTLLQFQGMWQSMGIAPPKRRAEINHFRFGNGHLETAAEVVDIPVGLAGKKGILQAAIVKGSAPLLVSRPALKRLNAVIDFGQDRLSLFHGQQVVPLQVNSAGQYMVDVMQFVPQTVESVPEIALAEPAMDARVLTSPSTAQHRVVHEGSVNHHEEVIGSRISHNHGDINRRQNEMPCHAAQHRESHKLSKKQIRRLKSQVHQASKPLGQNYAVIEVFSMPRVTAQVEKMGLKGLAVDKLLGHDLTVPATRKWLLEEVEQRPPELLVLCPPCTDAGGWFHLNKCFMSPQEYLRRKWLLRGHLKLCKELMKIQLKHGGRFIFEHPVGSAVWKDSDMRKWCNDLTSFVIDMCCFNLNVPATSQTESRLIRKSTRLLVSHADMSTSLRRRCPGETDPQHKCHAPVAGSHPTVGKVSVHSGRYTPEFVQAMIDAVPALHSHEVLVLSDAVHDVSPIHDVLVADQEGESDESLLRVLTKLHNNLGHPSTPEFLRVLKHGKASDRAIKLASSFTCQQCEASKGPSVANPAQVQHATVFNHKIGIDVKNLPGWRPNQKIKALNVVDYASNFQLMIPFFETETATVLRQLLNDRWFAWAGPPKEIVMDPARTNLGKALVTPCELEGSHIRVTAAGAHWQLGKVEVHGGIFCRVLERVLQERSPSSQQEWLDCVRHCHVKNCTIQTHGFTPSQVVFGRNPDLPGELLNEPVAVVPATASLFDESVQNAQATRHAAQQAILELQDAKSMRRALAARPRVARTFRSGDIVAYWRDQKWTKGTLVRGGQWHGSAVVIGHVGRNIVLAHRNHILRCAPEQVRMATDSERQLIQTPETQLLGIKDMLEGGTFRSSQYVDLLPQSYPPVENVVANLGEQPSADVPAAGESHLDVAGDDPMVESVNVPDDPNRVPQPSIPDATRDTDMPSSKEGDVQNGAQSQDRSDVMGPVDVSSSSAPDATASSSSSQGVVPNSSESSSYGPLRYRLNTKKHESALYRPPNTTPDDFVEIMREVLPHLVDQAVATTSSSSKREAPLPAEGAETQTKVPRNLTTEQLSVQPALPSEITCDEAMSVMKSLGEDSRHEVLIAQYLQKRLQKELKPSGNEPMLQAQIDAAKTAEWNTLAEKGAVRLVSASEANWIRKHKPDRIMGSRFVITKKVMEDIAEYGITPDPHNPEHWKVKARWCLQGHLDPDLTCKASTGMLQSPTLSQMSRMTLFQLLASHGWTLQLGDIKGAFLEAGALDQKYRPLYAWIPVGGLPGASQEQLVEILGNVYGQNDAPAAWYKVFDQEVLKAGFTRSHYDPCLYYLRDSKNQLCGLLGAHVDDTVTGGSGQAYDDALKYLRHRFPYRKWRVGEGEFCGAHYKQNEKTKEITMSQSTFAQSLKPAYLPQSRRAERNAPLNAKEVSVLRAINGSLNWLASQSRPDLAAQTSLSQQAMSKPQVHHLCEVNNVISSCQAICRSVHLFSLNTTFGVETGMPQ